MKISFKILLVYTVLFLLPFGLPAEDPVMLYREGNEAYLMEDYYKAIEKLKNVVILNPYYFDAFLVLAKCFYALDEYEVALGYIETGKKLEKNEKRILNLEGMIRIGMNEHDAAREIFSRVLEEEPNNLEARFGLAELDIADGRKRQAVEKFFNTLEVAPKNKIALVHLITLYIELEDYVAAEQYLELALKFHAGDSRVHFEAGKYYFTRKEYRTAKKYLNTALALKPDYYKVMQLLGIIEISLDNHTEALKRLKSSLELTDNFEQALSRYYMAVANEGLGNTGEAIGQYNLALGLHYDDEISRLGAEGLALEKLSDKEPARHELAEYHFLNGEGLYELNFFRNALTEYRRCLLLNPDHKAARVNFSGIYKALGYPVKYYYMLRVLKDYYGYKDLSLLDEIEVYESLLYDTVTAKWTNELKLRYDNESAGPIFNQYTIEKSKYNLSIFTIPTENHLVHRFSDHVLITYLKELFLRFETLEIKNKNLMITSYDAAFREAKNNGSDYFLIFQFEENDRSFEAAGKIYLSRTGSEMDSFKLFRTGNRKVENTLFSLSAAVFDVFPLKGKLILRNFNKGIINLGKLEGLKKEDKLLIIKKNKLKPDTNRIMYLYEPEDLLGEFVVTGTDENLSQGIIHKKSFFDYINPGDEMLFIPAKEEEQEAD